MEKRFDFYFFAPAIAAVVVVSGCGKSPETSASMPAPSVPAASAPTANVADRDVTEHVTTALYQNDALKGFNIAVVTLKGDVRLTGVVDTQAQIDEAIKIARAADGAHTIHDELTLKR